MNEKENIVEKYKEILEANTFANINGVVIDTVYEDFASGHMDITADSMNSYGAVHGGAYFVLADVTAALCAASTGRKHVTQQSSMNFIRAAVEGRLHCQATTINRGRTFCIIETKIFDDNQKLMYSGTFNYFCIEKDK